MVLSITAHTEHIASRPTQARDASGSSIPPPPEGSHIFPQTPLAESGHMIQSASHDHGGGAVWEMGGAAYAVALPNLQRAVPPDTVLFA